MLIKGGLGNDWIQLFCASADSDNLQIRYSRLSAWCRLSADMAFYLQIWSISADYLQLKNSKLKKKVEVVLSSWKKLKPLQSPLSADISHIAADQIRYDYRHEYRHIFICRFLYRSFTSRSPPSARSPPPKPGEPGPLPSMRRPPPRPHHRGCKWLSDTVRIR